MVMDKIISHITEHIYGLEKSYIATAYDGTTFYIDHKLQTSNFYEYDIHHMASDEKVLPYYWLNKDEIHRQCVEFFDKHCDVPYNTQIEMDVKVDGKSFIKDQGFYVSTDKTFVNQNNTITTVFHNEYFIDFGTIQHAQDMGEPLVFPCSHPEDEDFTLEVDNFLGIFIESSNPEAIRRAYELYESEKEVEEMMEELARPNEQWQAQRLQANAQLQSQLQALATLSPEARAAALNLIPPSKQAIIGNMLMMNMQPQEHQPAITHQPDHGHDHDNDEYSR